MKKIIDFYWNGFKNMPAFGKRLWLIILIKLFIILIILKFFFFPNFLNSKFDSETEKSNYVMEQLTNK